MAAISSMEGIEGCLVSLKCLKRRTNAVNSEAGTTPIHRPSSCMGKHPGLRVWMGSAPRVARTGSIPVDLSWDEEIKHL